jgi:hypothetical protein
MYSAQQSNSIDRARISASQSSDRLIRRLILAYCCAVLGVCVLSPAAAHADWNVGDPYKMHYPQLPDLTPTGLDVLATRDPFTTGPNGPVWKVLADDFRCTQTGPITDIHIWGSWLDDQVFTGVQFKLSIHADQPATPTGGPSTPIDPPLWQAIVAPSSQRLYSTLPPTVAPEQFFDPNTNQIIGTDRQIWQYNFVNLPQPFIQQAGTIYWLDVQALVPDGSSLLFGWKTTNPQDPRTPHFMDDAVYADTPTFAAPAILPYKPLVYPSGHPYAGLSIDLAFVITGVPEPASLTLIVPAALLLTIGSRRLRT